MPQHELAHTVLVTLIFGGMGMALFAITFWIIVKITPFSIRKEIEEDQNIALAVLIGAVLLGIAWIVGAAVHG